MLPLLQPDRKDLVAAAHCDLRVWAVKTPTRRR
jgi:hypothetical protein